MIHWSSFMEFDSSSANELFLTLEPKYLHAAQVVYVGGQQLWRNRMCKTTLPGLNPGCQIGNNVSQISRDESSAVHAGISIIRHLAAKTTLVWVTTITARHSFQNPSSEASRREHVCASSSFHCVLLCWRLNINAHCCRASEQHNPQQVIKPPGITGPR